RTVRIHVPRAEPHREALRRRQKAAFMTGLSTSIVRVTTAVVLALTAVGCATSPGWSVNQDNGVRAYGNGLYMAAEEHLRAAVRDAEEGDAAAQPLTRDERLALALNQL